MTSKHTDACRIELFGGIRIIGCDRVITHFRLQKAALLLAYLALAPHRTHSRERIIDIFWPEMELEAGRDNLSTTLTSLKREFLTAGVAGSPFILEGRAAVGINSEFISTDVDEFDALLKRASSTAAVATRSSLLEQAVQLYRGEVLEACYEDWALAARLDFQNRYHEALIDLAEDLETQNSWEAAQRAVERVVAQDPLREEAILVLMRLHARQGMVSGALDRYSQYSSRLKAELGAEPASDLRLLADRLRSDPDVLSITHDAPKPRDASSSGRPAASDIVEPPDNLPYLVTSFVGRSQETAEIAQHLGSGRLITLTGIGGCGKSRLSIEVGRMERHRYRDGVFLVELAALKDPALIASSIALPLGIKEQRGMTMMEALTARLKDQSILLILDNCEHLIDACARTVTELLRSCSLITVIATSREPLMISGEQTYRVPSLGLPTSDEIITPSSAEQHAAMKLFVDRARLVRQDFRIAEPIASIVARVCQRLDGIPLAIELAAARIRSISIQELEARLDDCFGLLTVGDRSALPRQQTLKALIDWSYDLLNADEKLVFIKLAVFAGGWNLQAAIAVCGHEGNDNRDTNPTRIHDILTSLSDKSLVICDYNQAGEARYRLLETVRQYARDRLIESHLDVETRRRHRDFYLDITEENGVKLGGPLQARVLSVLGEDLDNLRQAIALCLESPEDIEKGLRFGSVLWQFWLVRGHLTEGRSLFSTMLQACRTHIDDSGLADSAGYLTARAGALNGAGNLARDQSDYQAAKRLFEEALTIANAAGDKRATATAYNGLGNVANDQGDLKTSRFMHERSLAIRRAIQDLRGVAVSLNCLGNHAYAERDFVRAKELYEDSLEIQRELGDLRGIAAALGNLGVVAHSHGDYASAHARHAESLALFKELGDKRSIAMSLGGMVNVVLAQGDNQTAASLLAESLRIRCELGDKRSIAVGLSGFASLAIRERDFVRATLLLSAGYHLRNTIGSTLFPVELDAMHKEQDLIREQLPLEVFELTWRQGSTLSWDQAVDYALQEKLSRSDVTL